MVRGFHDYDTHPYPPTYQPRVPELAPKGSQTCAYQKRAIYRELRDGDRTLDLFEEEKLGAWIPKGRGCWWKNGSPGVGGMEELDP